MFGVRTLPLVASLFLLLTAAVSLALAQPRAFSQLQRDTDVLQGTIETISPATRTLVLRCADGTRQTIHYDTATVVFHSDTADTTDVVPGLEALVRCRRVVAVAREQRPDLCPVQLIADRVYLAAH